MHTRTATALLLAAMLGLAACSSTPTPDPAACRTAIKAQYIPGTATLKGDPTEPPACQGLSSDEISKIAEGVIEENTK
jgi:hypothetical protein